MIILMGIGLIGSHFIFLMALSNLVSAVFPAFGFTIFLVLAVLSGFGMMRIQTKLEQHFINKHIQKRPNSGWRVVVSEANKEKPSPQARWRRVFNA